MKRSYLHKNAKQGFTLIELLVVISIIGVLAGLLFVNFANIRERGRDTQRKSNLNQMKTALRLYYNDYQTYPAASSGKIAGCGADGDEVCEWGDSFGPTGSAYIVLPEDPLAANDPTKVYTYAQTNSGNGFTLTAELENVSDAEAAASQGLCGVADVDVEAGVYMVCAQ